MTLALLSGNLAGQAMNLLRRLARQGIVPDRARRDQSSALGRD
jgi:hypothetical protein